MHSGINAGDSEFDGTGIETHINGKFKLTLHKAGSSSFPKKLKNLTFPLIENLENYIIQVGQEVLPSCMINNYRGDM